MLISLTITGDTPSSVSLRTLTRADTGTTPVGISPPLPQNMTLANGAWTYSFTDTQTPATGYNYTYQMNWSDGSSDPGSGFMSADAASGTATGYYAVESDIDNVYGSFNVALWSNKNGQAQTDGNGNPVADETQVQAALNAIDAKINYLASIYKYATPLPTTIANWPQLNQLAAEAAGIKLYIARGIQDSGNDQTGKFEARWNAVMGYVNAAGKEIPGEIERMFIDKAFADAPRKATVTAAPFVVISPTITPYRSSSSFSLPASNITQVP
jgi:hypothetical protein